MQLCINHEFTQEKERKKEGEEGIDKEEEGDSDFGWLLTCCGSWVVDLWGRFWGWVSGGFCAWFLILSFFFFSFKLTASGKS